MKRKFATIMVATLFALSLSACGSSSEESIIDTEEAADEANEEVESAVETQAAEETEIAPAEAAPAETTEAAPAETAEATPAETAPADATQGAVATEGTDGTAAASGASGEVEGGTNQALAVPIALDQQIMSTNESSSWYSFTTSSNPDSDYQVSIINMSGEGSIYMTLKDLFGGELAHAYGESDGAAATCSSDQLEADTTYYIEITNYRGGPLDFALAVRETEKK